MANTKRDMNFYPGRKVVFLKLRNKFRFVSISLLLASLVTVVSSASADETGEFAFDLTVECAGFTPSGTWAPVLEKWSVGMDDNIVSFPSGYSPAFSISARPGQTVEIQIFLNWEDGIDCSGTTAPATGEFRGIFVGLPEGYTNHISGFIVEEVGNAPDTEINDFFDIPDDALNDVISGSYELTWTP
jgi:hypothetical protein